MPKSQQAMRKWLRDRDAFFNEKRSIELKEQQDWPRIGH
jgi:hypothetical protein